MAEYITAPRKGNPMEIQCEVRFASLIWNNEIEWEPHYYAQEIAKDSKNIWLEFPWESFWLAPV
jgi:hypothetical protein